MRHSSIMIVAIGVTLLGSWAVAEHPELKAFPKAKNGMDRLVIELPSKTRAEEGAFKVELIPGKHMMTDGVNLTRLGTDIKACPLKGWGYTYYEVTGSGQTMSTLMAVPEGAEKVNQFVQGESILVRYNSRLPIVIYVPKGYDVRYRIWTAGSAKKVAKG